MRVAMPSLECDHTRVLRRTVDRKLSLHHLTFAQIRWTLQNDAVNFRQVSPCLDHTPSCNHKAFRKHLLAYASSARTAIRCMMVGTTAVYASNQHFAEKALVQVAKSTGQGLELVGVDICSRPSVGSHPRPQRRLQDLCHVVMRSSTMPGICRGY